MKLPLYERIALTQDLEEHGLRKGDVGVLVDYVPHPAVEPREGLAVQDDWHLRPVADEF